MKMKYFYITMILIVLLTSVAYANFQYGGRGCKGNQICDTTNTCDANGCTTTYDNCQSCGVTTKLCGTTIKTAQNTCVDSGTPSCSNAAVSCPAGSEENSIPHVVLTFNVFTKKNLVVNITPPTHTALAGTTVNYKVSIKNNNPKTLKFGLGAEVPSGWSVSMPAETSVGQSSTRDVVIRVASNETTSDGNYPILVGIFNEELSLFGTVQADYIVASRGAPGVNTTPRSQEGYPGETIFYNVTVTNNDPTGFDASTISLRAEVPEGFEYAFNPRSVKLQPGEDGSTMLEVTSPENVTEEKYDITINATMNKLHGLDFIEYKITLCGNSVCDQEEENVCMQDCPIDPYIICNGRCDKTVDDGVDFTAVVSATFNKLIICSKDATEEACKQAADLDNCGEDSACLCTGAKQGSMGQCHLRCVDTEDVYYMFADGPQGIRSIANYSYVCPYVDMPDFLNMKDGFVQARDDYEKARSALLEVINSPNSSTQEKAEGRTCVDGLGAITYDISEFIKYLDDVIDWPGIINTTEARSLAQQLTGDIDTRYNAFCKGASGLLQIDTISAATVEKNSTAYVDVIVQNVGNTVYYGMVSCDITGAVGERETVNTSCASIGGQMYNTFQLPVNVYSAGKWSAKCKVQGSLLDGCQASTLHDESTGNFDVYTRETFIVDVSGQCTNETIECTVRSTRGGCTTCKINDVPCQGVGTINNTDYFECDLLPPGTYTLVGSVLDSSQCWPIEPAVKNTTARCAGCGDGIVDIGEQCELPYTDNSQSCVQSPSICQGKMFGIRDQAGFCDTSCGCSYDEYDYACVAGKCEAECQDGETRLVFLNKTEGTCSCTQQCGSGCSWNLCDCEPGMVFIPLGLPSVTVTHSPAAIDPDTQVTLLAIGDNATNVEIYVDGHIIKTCSALPCSVGANYASGVHNYYARVSNKFGFASDPVAGLKTFVVSGDTTITGDGGLNTTSVLLDVSHTPTDVLTKSDTVILAAVAHGPNSFKEINVFVDGSLRKSCPNYPSSLPCTYRSPFDVGSHDYHAVAIDSKNNFVRDPVAGTKTFVITEQTTGDTDDGDDDDGGIGPQLPPGVEPQTGDGSCYAEIVEKRCTYNDISRRYDIYLSAVWDNGTHAHWEIENNLGPKLYAYVFNHTEQMAGPGLKRIKLLVHNASDDNLCFVSNSIYCGPGSSDGREVDLIFDIKDSVGLGRTDVRMIVVPYTDIDFARIATHVDSRANVTFLRAEGNRSQIGVSKNRVQLDQTYNVHTYSTRLEAGRNISIIYNMDMQQPGQYDMFSLVNYSDKEFRFEKSIKVSSCPQTYSVLAKGPSGVCRDFSTPCDVPAGWDQVPDCDFTPIKPIEGEDNTMLLALAALLVILLGAVGYKYRRRIRERLGNLRGSRRREEPTSIDFEARR